MKPKKIIIGLRDAKAPDIAYLKSKYKNAGYGVTHVTKNLPHNGILKCILIEDG